MEASLTVKGRKNDKKLNLGGKMSVKRRKRSCEMAKYSENRHIKTVGLPPNLNFVQKYSPATVKTNMLPTL